jgi:hypothetical protein
MALDQADCSFEVLVAAADARLPALVGERDDPRVLDVPLPAGLGASASRNRAARVAHGSWLAFLEPTDLWAPDHLATMIAACEDADADFGYCASWIVDEQRRTRSFRTVQASADLAAALLTDDVIGSPSAVIVRHAFWKRAGGFDEWLADLAPWDTWIRWSRLGSACASPAPTVAITEFADRGATRAQRDELRELRRRYEGDARAAGVRFGTGAADDPTTDGRARRWRRRMRGLLAPTAVVEPPVDTAGPPWLTRADRNSANTTSGG